jgi:hypothetical protein
MMETQTYGSLAVGFGDSIVCAHMIFTTFWSSYWGFWTCGWIADTAAGG